MNIEILSEQTQLIRGAAIEVRIRIRFDKPTRVRGIRAEFYGAEKTKADYTVTTTDSKGKTRTETRTAIQHVDIVCEKFLLHGEERKGFFSRIGDSVATLFGGGSHEVMGPGGKEFVPRLTVPEDAPHSFKGKKCEVFYRLSVDVDLPIKMDKSESKDFDVAPVATVNDSAPVISVFPDESGRSIWDKTFGRDVKLNLAIDRGTLCAGEKARAMLTIESPEPLKIDEMAISLVGLESTVADGHNDTGSHMHPLGNIDSPRLISSDSAHEFDIVIPEVAGPHTVVGTHFEVAWSIEVRLKIPWAKDPKIRVPVRIVPSANFGSEPGPQTGVLKG